MTNDIAHSNCEACPAHHLANLKKLGIEMGKYEYVIALTGNPNTGKSTVFNQLTGLRQHTGNWPGKTVARAEGGFSYQDTHYKLVDLPGTYSLLSTSTDEEISRDFILFGQPDVTVVVVDATLLERNLNLVFQVLEITNRALLCLNLMDEAERHKLTIDHRRLARDLGVPVIPTVARQGKGIPLLIQMIAEIATGQISVHPQRIQSEPPTLKRAVQLLVKKLQTVFPELPNARWVALRLLEGDRKIEEEVRSGRLGDLMTRSLSTEGEISRKVIR